MPRCSKCDKDKPESEFYEGSGGTYCKDCQKAYAKEWDLKHPERCRERRKRWKEKNPEKFKKSKRKCDKKRYEADEDYRRIRRERAVAFYRGHKLELVKFMGGKCSICGLTPNDVDGCMNVFVVDEIIPLGIGKRKFTNLTKKMLKFAKKLFLEEKLQLLCQNCNAIKTWQNNDCAYRPQPNLY